MMESTPSTLVTISDGVSSLVYPSLSRKPLSSAGRRLDNDGVVGLSVSIRRFTESLATEVFPTTSILLTLTCLEYVPAFC